MTVARVDCRDTDAADRFTDALLDTGFVILDHVGLDPEILIELRSCWSAFFAADEDEKARYVHGPGRQDGYHPMSSRETALGARAPDLKEFFHWYPWGCQPADVTAASSAFYERGVAIADTLLRWLDTCLPRHLGAPLPQTLRSMLSGSRRTLLRIAHYPPLSADSQAGGVTEGAMRAAPHEDINLITLLPPADAPGLQVLHRSGVWIDVPDDPGTLTVNAGDMLQLVSGGVVRSATHRVVNPVDVHMDVARLSTPLFIQPADAVELTPGRTAFEFQAARLRAIRGIELAPLPSE